MNTHTAKQDRCKTCQYVMQSESSNTGLRCGYEYFHGSLILRKVRLMTFYPVINHFNVCEKFSLQPETLRTFDPLSI